jgi:hypothetical protein
VGTLDFTSISAFLPFFHHQQQQQPFINFDPTAHLISNEGHMGLTPLSPSSPTILVTNSQTSTTRLLHNQVAVPVIF